MDVHLQDKQQGGVKLISVFVELNIADMFIEIYIIINIGIF